MCVLRRPAGNPRSVSAFIPLPGVLVPEVKISSGAALLGVKGLKILERSPLPVSTLSWSSTKVRHGEKL